MPVNIMVGILALVIALVLYTMAVWQALRAKGLKPKQLYLLWIGFAFDVIATAMMAVEAGGIERDLHTLVASIGMFGMLAAAAVGTWAQNNRRDDVLASVARLVVIPWVVWAVVFVWGMASRGAERVGA